MTDCYVGKLVTNLPSVTFVAPSVYLSKSHETQEVAMRSTDPSLSEIIARPINGIITIYHTVTSTTNEPLSHPTMMYTCLVSSICICLVLQASSFSSKPQRSPHPTSILKAMIFYPEGDDGPPLPNNDMNIHPIHNSLTPDLEKRHDELVRKLSSMERILARLAASFSPVGHAIDRKHIQTVRCSSLDNRHLEIEATLCDDYECNSLLVPVQFPQECGWETRNNTFEECVLSNVNSLDQEEERRSLLYNEPSFANLSAESVYATLESAEELLRDAPSYFPDWWIPANTKEDVSDCELLKGLLNEDDMMDARVNLLGRVRNSESNEVRFVEVRSVGPMGLILKVIVENCDGRILTEWVPIKFFEGACSIREKTLELLSAVDV